MFGRRGLASAGAIAMAVAVGLAAPSASTAADAATGTAQATSTAQATAGGDPVLAFAHQNSDLLYGTAYRAAVRNLTETNTVPYDPNVYDTSGLMSDPPGTFIKAGGGYPQPWTRDASLNTWNAANLLEPDAARNTLWSVVDKDADGQLVVQQDNQQWDQVIWVTGAWNHYLVTGDRTFLGEAYQASVNTLHARETAASRGADFGFNTTYGLFEGLGFFNDGVAGYPSPPVEGDDALGAGAGSYPAIRSAMMLSTNEVYYEAYVDAADMAKSLRRPAAEVRGYQAKAAALKKAINTYLWLPKEGRYGYFIHNGDALQGQVDDHEEGTGLAFALMFGIASPQQAREIVAHTHTSTWGITDTYPTEARYSEAEPGRHNAMVWPMVQGMWASGLADVGAQVPFAQEVGRLAELADNSSGFYEIYNADTGAQSGGWQAGTAWGSQPDQTWSATAYLRMIYDGVFGLDFTTSGIGFAPSLPAGWGDVTLSGISYRQADLTVRLHGAGNVVSGFTVDGRRTDHHSVPADLTGRHTVDITLTGAPRADRDGDHVLDAADTCPDQPGTAALHGCPAPTRLQAEDAINRGGTKVSTNDVIYGADAHTGYDGRGYVDGIWQQGASSTFPVHRAKTGAATYDLTIRYANASGDGRTLSLYADGAKVRQVQLPPVGTAGDWNTWGQTTVTGLTLSGAEPTVTLKWDAGDTGQVNLDWVGLTAG
ncbi:carbohydrate-binding protein [Actinacidiphila yeochonensis]|uniref:carbohydrate-binding protein n=1 Tax=Actinacidiphila yeochonensis TaxID=89050 RepID=UPI00068CF7B6|nr:carbohydrate-binding protein [Actinacidiphila yeochonensis]